MPLVVVLRKPPDNPDQLPGLGVVGRDGRLLSEAREVLCTGAVRVVYRPETPLEANGTRYWCWVESEYVTVEGTTYSEGHGSW